MHAGSTYRRKPGQMNQPPPQNERPRERLLTHGVEALTSPELLAIILRTGTTGCGAVALGHALMQQFNGLRGLLSASPTSLMDIRGLGRAKACQLLAVSELSRRSLQESLAAPQAMNQPALVRQFCAARLAHLPVEHCIALYLNNQYQLLATELVSQGTLSQANVYPREIVRAALRHHAAAVVLAHNHPSGSAEPSQADLRLTQHLKSALGLIDIQLLDHIIVSAAQTVSLAERGVM